MASAASHAYKFTNRLIASKSPYLLKHAHNPVDWYPWGEEAFTKARLENKVVLVSIGYSSCYWCSVMERESFENEEIATLMNENFVCIKVDREELPNVDRTYMTFVTVSTGSGGWPLNVFLTPDLKPFFGGTYFPPHETLDRQSGWDTVLRQISQLWKRQPNQVLQSSTALFNAIASVSSGRYREHEGQTAPPISARPAVLLFQELATSHDHHYGGFGPRPKFPTPVIFKFLKTFEETMSSLPSNRVKPGTPVRDIQDSIRMMDIEVDLEGEPDNALSEDMAVLLSDEVKQMNDLADIARQMREFTLEKIDAGGIHDHVGGGFHRYSVDEKWHVPHFEKMLYDQGQLLAVYADVPERFKSTIDDIVGYVTTQLRHRLGGFFSSEDAESYPGTTTIRIISQQQQMQESPSEEQHGRTKNEGAFAVWTYQEIQRILGPELAPIFNYVFGVQQDGNVDPRYDHRGDLKNQNILCIAHSYQEAAQQFGKTVDAIQGIIERCKDRMKTFRLEKRPRPSLDDKIISSWNGLMISGLSQAALQTESVEALDAAIKAASFVKSHLVYPHQSQGLQSQAQSLEGQCQTPGTQVPIPQLRLARYWKEDEQFGHGECSDYANVIAGLLDLYRVSLDPSWLQLAIDLQDTQDAVFYDAEVGNYYCTESAGPEGLRLKEEQDGAEPSPSSVSVQNLLILSALVPRRDKGERYRRVAERVLHESFDMLMSTPRISPLQCANALWWLGSLPHVAVIHGRNQNDAVPYLRLLREHRVWPFFIGDHEEQAREQQQQGQGQPIVSLLEKMNEIVTDIKRRPVPVQNPKECEVWLCEKGVCGLPISNINELEHQLSQRSLQA